MKINRWPGRNILLIWALAAGVMFAGLWLADQVSVDFPSGSVYVAMASVGLPFLAAVVVTWRWMSGRS